MVARTLQWRFLPQVVANLRGFRATVPVGDMLDEVIADTGSLRVLADALLSGPPASPPLRGHQRDQPPIISQEYVRIVAGLYSRYDVVRVVRLNGDSQLTVDHPSFERPARISRSSITRLPLEERFSQEPHSS